MVGSRLLKVLCGSAHSNGIAFAQSRLSPFGFIEVGKLGNFGGVNKNPDATAAEVIENTDAKRGVSSRCPMGIVIKEVVYYNCPDIIFVYFAESILLRRLDD